VRNGIRKGLPMMDRAINPLKEIRLLIHAIRRLIEIILEMTK